MSNSEDPKDSVTPTPNPNSPDSNVKKFVENINPTGIFSSGYESLKTYIFVRTL